MEKLDAIKNDFEKAVGRLQEVLDIQEQNDIIRDSAIQRFEFTFDLAWKAMKSMLLARYGIACSSPKSCIRDAFQNKLLEYEKSWIDLCDLRNMTSHTYDEKTAREVFSQLPHALKLFKELQRSLGA